MVGVGSRSFLSCPMRLPPPSSTIFNSTTLEATQALSPTSPLDRTISHIQEGDSSSQGFENAMDYEEEGNNLYFELKDLDPVISTDSSKKRKIEEEDGCSSHYFN